MNLVIPKPREESALDHSPAIPGKVFGWDPGLKTAPLLEVLDLTVSFVQYSRGLRQKLLRVITGLSLDIRPGEIVAVVGASGSGKSLLAHAVLGIQPDNAVVGGSLLFDGQELSSERQAHLRGRDMVLIPQSVNFLDPLMKVGRQVRYAVRGGDPVNIQRQVFARYHLAPRVEDLYPFQLSGGMARRILVAMALVSGARLIIADEPTPGLDPLVLEEAMGHFRELADEGRGIMFITHDINNALNIADRIAVFYAGTTVEIAPVSDFAGKGESLRHPYTRALWRALPQNGFVPIAGRQPHPEALPAGCLFYPRCSLASDECRVKQPDARTVRGGMVRCFHAS